jgi:hypothetical protein
VVPNNKKENKREARALAKAWGAGDLARLQQQAHLNSISMEEERLPMTCQQEQSSASVVRQNDIRVTRTEPGIRILQKSRSHSGGSEAMVQNDDQEASAKENLGLQRSMDDTSDAAEVHTSR